MPPEYVGMKEIFALDKDVSQLVWELEQVMVFCIWASSLKTVGPIVCKDCGVLHGGCMTCDSVASELAERGHRRDRLGRQCPGARSKEKNDESEEGAHCK